MKSPTKKRKVMRARDCPYSKKYGRGRHKWNDDFPHRCKVCNYEMRPDFQAGISRDSSNAPN